MARKRRDYLSRGAEELALALMWEASGGTIGKIRKLPEGIETKAQNVSFSDRRSLLDSVVKLIAKRHDMAPDDEPEDGINAYKDMLNGSASGESGNRGASSETSLSDSDNSSDDA